jgi:hypothetical protein
MFFYPTRSDRRVPSSTPTISHIQPCVPRVFQISASVRHANPSSRQLRNFMRDEFLSRDTFLFFILLPSGTIVLVLLQ